MARRRLGTDGRDATSGVSHLSCLLPWRGALANRREQVGLPERSPEAVVNHPSLQVFTIPNPQTEKSPALVGPDEKAPPEHRVDVRIQAWTR